MTLMLGAGTAKVLTLASMPLLTRIYTPEDFGLLASLTALTAVFAPLLGLRYSNAIPLPRRDSTAFHVMVISLVSSAVGAIVVAILLWIAISNEWPYSESMKLGGLWWLLPVSIILVSSYETLSYWATRKKAFKSIARTQFNQAFIGSTSKLVLGLTGLSTAGLLYGQIAQHGGGIYRLVREFRSDFISHMARLKSRVLIRSISYYRDFPLLRLPSHFIYTLSAQAPLLYAAAVWEPQITGQFGLAVMAMALPIALISQTASNAYFGEISSIGKRNIPKLLSVTEGMVKWLLAVGIGVTIFVNLLAPVLFEFLFGKDWIAAGEFAAALSAYLGIQLVAAPLMTILNVLKRQALALRIHITRLVLTVVSLYLAHRFLMTPLETIQLYAIALSIHFSIVSISMIRLLR